MAKQPMTEEKESKLKLLCSRYIGLQDCAAILDVGRDKLEQYIKKYYNQTFREFRADYLANTKLMIINKILEKCQEGHWEALKYASRNICHWSDKPEFEMVQYDLDFEDDNTVEIDEDGNVQDQIPETTSAEEDF